MQDLNLLLGRSGSGKSVYVAEEVRRIIENQKNKKLLNLNEKIIIIVPDQYTVAEERFYINLLGEEYLPFLRIVSFKRLAGLVFNINGGLAYEFIGQGGKIALLAKALTLCAYDLKYYPQNYYNIDFINHLGDAVKELKSGGIAPDELISIAVNEENDKLHDIALIYNSFNMLISDGFLDPDDNFTCISKVLEETKLFKETNIFIDNFKTFNVKELSVIKSLYISGAKITIALPTEDIVKKDGEYGLLSEITENAKKIAGMVRKYDGKLQIKKLTEQKRYKNEELAFLESNIFGTQNKKYENIPKNISLYRAGDTFDEVDYIASKITELVRDFGYKFNDFVVIGRDIDNYAGLLDPVFTQYNIPLFYHKKTPLRQKAPAVLISSIFSMVVNGYNDDNVFDYLKTGLLGISTDDISLFEAYITRWNIRYNRYLMEFTLNVRGYVSEEEELPEDFEALKRINAVRESVIKTVESFRFKINGVSVREISKAVYELLIDLNIEKKLEELAVIYQNYNEQALFLEQEQIFDLIINALDELVLVCGADVVSLQQYRDIMMSIIDINDIGIIPTSLDEVLAGNVDSLPFMSPRCVFVLGLNDGVFPKEISDNGLINDEDKTILERYDIELGMNSEKKLLYERFLAYSALSSASERLFLSYSGILNGAVRPSMVVTEVLKLFPKLMCSNPPKADDKDGLAQRLQGEQSSFFLYSRWKIKELKDYFENTDYSKFINPQEESSETIGKDSGSKLFGSNMSLSASKVNKFYECRFSYFCRYGMRLSIPRKASLDAIEVGNFIHTALEKLLVDGIDEDDDVLQGRLKIFADEYIKSIFKGDKPSASFLTYFDRLVQKVFRILKLFKKEQEQSDFKPVAFELNIADNGDCKPVVIPVEDGVIKLTGIIDRVDIYKKDGKSYLRIIDYKSGAKHFDIQQIYHGLDMQMLMYLCSLRQNGKALYGEVIPSGVMYVNVNPVIVSIERGEGYEAAEKKLEQVRKRTGLFLDDPDVLRAMDKDLEGKYIPIKSKGKNQPLATLEQFGVLFDHIKYLLECMGRELLKGEISKNPMISGNVDSCKFCDFNRYCNRDNRQRRMEYINLDNIYDNIKEGIKSAEMDKGTT